MTKFKNIMLPLILFCIYIILGVALNVHIMSPILTTCVLNLVVIILWVFVKKRESFSSPISETLDKQSLYKFGAIAILLWIFGQCAGYWFYKNGFASGFNVYSDTLDSNVALSLVLTLLLAPMAEEIIFRGLIFDSWLYYMNKWTALICQSLLFSLAHGTMVHLIPTFVFSLFQGVLYMRTKKLMYCVIVHMIYNTLVFTLAVLPIPDVFSEIYIWLPIIIGCIILLFKEYSLYDIKILSLKEYSLYDKERKDGNV